MKNSIKLCLFAMVLFSISCNDSDELITETINDSQNVEAFSKATQPSVSVENVMNNAGEIVGSATLIRTEDGIKAKFKTSGLIPGNAYTLWFVIFNGPGIKGPPISTFAAGHIVGGSGKAVFSGRKSVGDVYIDTSDYSQEEEPRYFGNPLTADVHLVIRTHGQAQPGMIPSMIHTMEGGCKTGFDSGPGLHPDSDEVGYCANVQVAKHVVD